MFYTTLLLDIYFTGLSGGSDCKESACNASDPRFKEIPLKKGMATHSSVAGEFHGQRSLVGHRPWGSQRVRHEGLLKLSLSCTSPCLDCNCLLFSLCQASLTFLTYFWRPDFPGYPGWVIFPSSFIMPWAPNWTANITITACTCVLIFLSLFTGITLYSINYALFIFVSSAPRILSVTHCLYH